MSKSIEEKVEDFFKNQLNHEGIKYFTKTESMNPSIDKALQDAPSKSGGTGKNYPDIRCLLEDSKLRRVPVMIEAKGREGELIKLDKGVVVGVTTYEKDTKTHKKGDPNYSAIQKFAVNGAVHYATAVLNGKAAEECLAVGINGWNDASGDMKTEVSVWYVSNENQKLPKEVGKYSDLTFLKDADALTRRIDTLKLTQEEIDALTLKTEAELDKKLRNVNQVMQDTLQINVNYRVNLISGMIMAGLGVDGAVPPLKTDELNGYTSDTTLTVAKGPLTKEQEKQLDLVQKAYDEALKLYKPGRPIIDAAKKCDSVFAAAKRKMPHGLGHAVGLEIHEQPRVSLRATPEMLFKPGMILTCEPGLYDVEIGGTRLENDVLITEDGNEVLTHSRIIRL